MKSFVTSILLLSLSFAKAQSELYSKLYAIVSSQLHEDARDKLIAFNIWSVNNKNSRSLNQELEKTCSTYGVAKLKGGSKGMIGVIFCVDKDKVPVSIALNKDGITKLISITSDIKSVAGEVAGRQPSYNIFFDSNGKVVYEDLKEGTIWNSIRNLITR